MKYLLLLFMVTSMNVYAQQGITITGTVSDSGDPLPGVNITVKGTSTGTISDADGKYQITAPGTDATLVFSFIGYVSTEVRVGNQRQINVNLSEDMQMLEEVVVVGYGTQKKVNLTGAVAAVKVDETLANRTVQNVSSGLQGLLPGLAVAQNSAMAGANNVSLMIRGLGTVNNAEPLVVVDGMPDVNINRIIMSDIESITVLKDAAASSAYGSRAANGVILITTRTGKSAEKTQVNFTASHSWGAPTTLFEFMADYPRALELHRAANAVSQANESTQLYKKGTIDEWLALGMIDPLRYPNTNWWDIMLRTAKTQDYNVSATGNSDKANFFASVGVREEEGLQINNDYTRYTARFNFDFKVRHNINVGMRFSGNWTKDTYRQDGGMTAAPNDRTGAAGDMYAAISGITPYDPVTGYYGGVMAYNENAQAYNPFADFSLNINHRNRQEIIPSAYIDWSPVKGLTARADYSISYYNQFVWAAAKPAEGYNFQTENFMGRVYVAPNAAVSNTTNTGYKTTMSGRLDYHATLAANHDIRAFVLYSEEYWYDRSQAASRNDRVHPDLHEIVAALTTTQSNNGSSQAEGLRSVVGRVNYAAYDRYLLELNIRADGSSRFFEGHQWGFFPSASAGWRFSEENFLKPFVSAWLNQGKFRASYGSLGNIGGVGRYEQREVLSSANYWINTAAITGFANRQMINQNLSWEKTTVLNVGLDLGFLNNRLTAEIDYYDKLTTGMIRPGNISILLTGAYNAPRTNIGVMRNRGLETNINWRDRIGELNYMVNFNVAYNRSRLEKWNEYLYKGWIYIDMPYHYVLTYKDIGITQTWQDVYNATPQGISPGDIARLDVDGNGSIGSEDMIALVKNNRDRPTTNYGLNANASWKGIDLSVMFTAATGRKDFWINPYNNINPAEARYAFTWRHWYNPWSWENRDSEWPRFGGGGNNRAETEFWLDNYAYLRLKNMQIGYSLPKNWSNKVYIDNLRFYVSAENIATLTRYRGLDPEKGGTGDSGGNPGDLYPLMRSVSVGVNVKF